MPPPGWIKCNIDGAYRGNLGRSSYAFCIRDEHGDLIYAQTFEIPNDSNNEVKAKAILEAILKLIL